MRKIPKECENPIDNFLIDRCDTICPVFNKLGFTPNDITFMSLIYGLTSIYFIFKHNYLLASFFYFISYFLDCLDGFYARKYNLTSRLGDIFDHVKDTIIGSIVIFLLIYRMPKECNILFILLLVIFTLLMMTHMGCQEKMNKHNNSEMISGYRDFCKSEGWIHFTKFFGCGTFSLFIILSLFFLHLNKDK